MFQAKEPLLLVMVASTGESEAQVCVRECVCLYVCGYVCGLCLLGFVCVLTWMRFEALLFFLCFCL